MEKQHCGLLGQFRQGKTRAGHQVGSEAGVIQRRKRRKKQGELQEELHKHQATKRKKEKQTRTESVREKIEELGADKIKEAFPELSDEKNSLIKELLGGRWVGTFVCHAWDLGGNRVIFNGKM